MTDNENLKSILNIFVDKWNNTNNVWNNNFVNDLQLEHSGFVLKISFGQGIRVVSPKYPYITFLKYGQITSKGVYPFISYEYEKNKLVTGLGISRDNYPEVEENIINKIEEFPSSSFSINEIDLLIDKLNENIDKFEQIFNLQNENRIKSRKNNIMKTKNIMLYGAPGVGKTHNYQRLISMIENGDNVKTIFDTISKNEATNNFDNSKFEEVKRDKRMEFVTFHQSYSYEDFIEGFRPTENKSIELEDGIFKKISKNSSELLEKIETKQITYEDAYNILRGKYIDNTLDDLKTVSGKSILISNFEDKFIQVKSEDGKNWFNVKKNDLKIVVDEILQQTIHKPSDIKNTGVKKDTIALSGYYFPIGNKIVELIKESKTNIEEQKNFYIVIDEINRGNISKIFGELITLIEEDKRDSYEVTLPYSKEKFKIPSNLYIIATMNSTDKSIATIDIALRRRFTFLKMKSNIDLVPQIAQELFTKLNDHIEKAINEDYKLGHSYFMKIQTEEDLEFVKEYKIKPLLEEYFYGDEENYKKALEILNKEENL